MTTPLGPRPPGPRPPGSPGDCDALAAICLAYAGALDSEVHDVGRVYGFVGSGRWTGRAADAARDTIDGWQQVAMPAADTLRYLAARLRRAAIDLEQAQAAWRHRADVYAEYVRDKGRWGPT